MGGFRVGAHLMLHYARATMKGGAGGGGGFTPLLRTYTVGTAATETIPANATTVVLEVWGGGGGGGSGTPAPDFGAGAGAAGYSRTTTAISGGQTLIYTVGAGGTTSTTGNDGAASSISSGTKTITTMTANGGLSRPTIATPGPGGTASGGVNANFSGAAGAAAGVGDTTAAQLGVNANLTGANGTGGASGFALAGVGSAGTVGMVGFYYT